MLKEILVGFDSVKVYKDGKEHVIEGIEAYLEELFEYAYFSSSVAVADHTTMEEQKKRGLWVELSFKEERKYNESRFEKLLFPLKPKYDYINLYRYYAREYQGRCLGLSLGLKTTDLYKFVMENIDD